MAAKPEKAKKQVKEQVYMVPVTWTMAGHYAIKAKNAHEAAEKSKALPLPDNGIYLYSSCEVIKDEIALITPEFSRLKVHE